MQEYFSSGVAAEIIRYAKEYYGVLPQYPWEDKDSAVLRHKSADGNGKWFALLMAIPFSRIEPDGDDHICEVMNIKCDPVMIGSLLCDKGFYRAYHMNKLHWITIILDGSVPFEQIQPLLELSYHLTAPKIRQKKGGRSKNTPDRR